MKSEKLHDWLQILGIVAIVASLVFVGFELKLSRQTTVADVYQQRTALSIQVQLSDLESFDRLKPIYEKLADDEPLTASETRYFISTALPWLSYWENVHFQHEMGLLSEEQWLSSRNSLEDTVTLKPFQEGWPLRRRAWRESFAQEVDKLIEQHQSKHELGN